MAKNENRIYRDMEIRARQAEENQDPEYKVEGYASTFERYTLWEDPDTGEKWTEQIDPKAFDETDMSDCVYRIDHEGKVYARTSAGDLTVSVDEHGLKTEADLSRTRAGREHYEEVLAGHYPRMSFAFTVAPDGDVWDDKGHARTINKIAKLYDVSPVSWPANPGTELDVATRDHIHGAMEVERAERLAREQREAKVRELTERITRLKNGSQRND